MAELKPVYLIGGGDRPKVARALRRLRERIGPEGTETLSATGVSGEDAIAACDALGFFTGEARLVVVEDTEAWKAADVKAVAAYVERPAPATVLALVAAEIKADSALAKACRKAGDVLAFDTPRKRDLPKWVAEQFARVGAEVDDDACRLLVELAGEDLQALTSEIEKAATWAGGERITTADVERLAAARTDASVFTLTDAWGRRDLPAALAAAEAVLEASPRELPRVIGLLSHHVGRVRACQLLAEEGVRPREAAGRLKMHPFAAEKAFAHAKNFSVEELRDATVRLAQLDHAVKGGSRLSGELELARTLIDITQPAEMAAAARA
jgi:DNA polymerase-3 subunit delta